MICTSKTIEDRQIGIIWVSDIKVFKYTALKLQSRKLTLKFPNYWRHETNLRSSIQRRKKQTRRNLWFTLQQMLYSLTCQKKYDLFFKRFSISLDGGNFFSKWNPEWNRYYEVNNSWKYYHKLNWEVSIYVIQKNRISKSICIMHRSSTHSGLRAQTMTNYII